MKFALSAVLSLLLLPSPASAQSDATAQNDRVRQDLMGKPVYGAGSGRIGEVSGLALSLDQSIASVVVTIDERVNPNRPHLSVPWSWVRPQLGNPTVMVPWDATTVAWATQRRGENAADDDAQR
ncbi:MAG TPA: hypothetical protein VK196_06220 [Magnetospirillum sp.]|nr:hypothetical protein [Magnetospirillum sp.]